MAAKNNAPAYRCRLPPFHFEDYETSKLPSWFTIGID